MEYVENVVGRVSCLGHMGTPWMVVYLQVPLNACVLVRHLLDLDNHRAGVTVMVMTGVHM
jgi:hypothetical protein